MPIPTWSVGQVAAAADVNNWWIPLAGIKTSNQSVTSSTTLVNDTALFVPLAANASYFISYYLDYEGGTQGSSDMKFSLAVPSSATQRHAPQYVGTNGAQQGAVVFVGATIACGTNGAGNSFSAIGMGTVVTSSTAGNLQVQWAQNTSNGTSTIMHTGSSLYAYRIG